LEVILSLPARTAQRSQSTPSRLLLLIPTVPVERVQTSLLSAERRINQEENNNEQERVWLKRHRFVTGGTRSKQINCYQQVTAVEHVINRGCSIVSIVPPPTMHLTHTTAQQVPA